MGDVTFTGMNKTVDAQSEATSASYKKIQDGIEEAADDPGKMLEMQWKMTLWNIQHQFASKTQQEAGQAMKNDINNAVVQ